MIIGLNCYETSHHTRECPSKAPQVQRLLKPREHVVSGRIEKKKKACDMSVNSRIEKRLGTVTFEQVLKFKLLEQEAGRLAQMKKNGGSI